MSCIVVLGIPRNGTSAVAGILYNLGVFMGNYLWEATPANPKGFFEDKEFWHIHQKMHKETTCDSSLDYPPLRFSPTPQTLQEYSELIKKREELKLWGIKDPMMCFALPYFLEIVKTDIKLIIVRRPFHESARSLVTSGFCKSINRATDRQGKYLYAMEEALSELNKGVYPILEINYQDLLCNSKKTITGIAKFIGVKLANKAVKFIDPTLNKHRMKNGNSIIRSDENISNIYMAYDNLKKSFDALKSKCEGLNAFQLLDELVSNGVDLFAQGKQNEAYTLFSKMLLGVNNIKGALMNNMALFHIKSGNFVDAEKIFNTLIDEGFNIDAVRENLHKLRYIKNKKIQTTPCVAENQK
ncbi:MAG: hypothetical protein HRF42_00610 [Candidatus Brocadia sp.]|jgi:tetratricopeptide (TPR) repeat protein